MVSTTKGGDFLGRALVNDNPGASDAKDYLGRNVTASNKDFMGRLLVDNASYPPALLARNTAVTLGQQRRLVGTKEVQTITATGTPVGNPTMSVTKNGVTRTTPNFVVNQANIQSQLVALDNVEPGDVTVTGTGPWTLTWQEELGNVAQVTTNNTGVTGGTYDAATTTQGAFRDEVYQVTVAGTTHASTVPTAPAVGATVVDGTATLKRLK